MDRLLDLFFWFLNNPAKSKKLWITTSTLLVLGLMILSIFLIVSLPETESRAITGG